MAESRQSTEACARPDRDLVALSLEVQKVSLYSTQTSNWAKAALLPCNDGAPRLTYLAAGECLAASRDPLLQSVGLWAIGRTLEQGETFAIDATHAGMKSQLTERQLYLQALQCDSTNAKVYTSLGTTLVEDETVDLPDGRMMTQRELYQEALRLDNSYSIAYYNLGNALSREETILLHDGRMLTARELYLEALFHDPNDDSTYNNLAITLASDETVLLRDGRTLSKHQLFLEAVRCSPRTSTVYNNFAAELSPDETVLLHDGRTLNRRQLYLEALRWDGNYSNAYYNLGITLSASDTVLAPDGRTLTARQCFLEALRCNGSDAQLRAELQAATPAAEPWSRYVHSLLFGATNNVLFATLLLGVQRLEEAGVLLLAHQAMLEDMLECWTWGDASQDGLS